MLSDSPLRYPGGKRRLTETVTQILEANDLMDIQYAEPFAGGAAVALRLLYEDYADGIHLNDLSRPVFAFWHTALNETEWLCSRLKGVRVTMRVWNTQRRIYQRRENADLAELGFATLFLNRCNRSGIISGGVIGGKSQSGKWRLDARFGKDDLIDRIRKIGRYSSRISIYQRDAIDFTKKVVPKLGKKALVFVDPPYLESGRNLYLNNYGIEDHATLAESVRRLKQPWLVTYDRAAISKGLYEGHRRVVYDLAYVAAERYAGREVMFISDGLALPTLREMMGSKMVPVPRLSQLRIA